MIHEVIPSNRTTVTRNDTSISENDTHMTPTMIPTMTPLLSLNEAIEILEYHQAWRQGLKDDMIHEPGKLTRAIDVILAYLKANSLYEQMKEAVNNITMESTK